MADVVLVGIVVVSVGIVLCLALQGLAMRTVDADVVQLEAEVAVPVVVGMCCIEGP